MTGMMQMDFIRIFIQDKEQMLDALSLVISKHSGLIEDYVVFVERKSGAIHYNPYLLSCSYVNIMNV